MKLQLPQVVSDMTGATGMRIIRAIVAGEIEGVGRSASTSQYLLPFFNRDDPGSLGWR